MTLGLPLQRKNMSEPPSKRKEATITAMVTGITAMDASMMWRQAGNAPGSTTNKSTTGWGCRWESRKMSVWKMDNVVPSKGFQMTMKRESALSWCSRGKRQSHETDKGERTVCPEGADEHRRREEIQWRVKPYLSMKMQGASSWSWHSGIEYRTIPQIMTIWVIS